MKQYLGEAAVMVVLASFLAAGLYEFQLAQARDNAIEDCIAASPARTDSEVEAMEESCTKLILHREMLGR